MSYAEVGIIALIVLLVTLIFVGPVFTIWAVNTLFDTHIPVNLKTWASALWLGALLGGSTRASSWKKQD